MIPRTKINLGEDLFSSQLIEQYVNAGKWIFIFDGYRIERPVVDTQPQTAIFLLYEQCGTAPRQSTWVDKTLVQQFL